VSSTLERRRPRTSRLLNGNTSNAIQTIGLRGPYTCSRKNTTSCRTDPGSDVWKTRFACSRRNRCSMAMRSPDAKHVRQLSNQSVFPGAYEPSTPPLTDYVHTSFTRKGIQPGIVNRPVGRPTEQSGAFRVRTAKFVSAFARSFVIRVSFKTTHQMKSPSSLSLLIVVILSGAYIY